MKVSNRIEKLRSKLSEKEIDGFLVSQPENRYYLSGFDGTAGYLFITAKEAKLATDFRYIERATAQAPDYKVYRITGKTEDWFPCLASELNLRQLGFEAEHMTFDQYHQLTGIMEKAKSELQLVPVDGFVESSRTIKEPEEIELINKAIEIGDRAFEHVQETIHPGMTEKQVAWEIEKFMRENGSQGIAFESIVAAGPNSALPHAKPSERPINQGEPIVLDLGARVEGYCGDLTRTLCLGQPDDTFKKVYDTVLGAQLTAIELIKEDMSGHEADRMARIVIEEAGHGEAFGHSLGHGIGLAAHEEPRLGPNSDQIITQGMVFSIEPGIYLQGWGGVRIEDLATIENGQIKVLSQASKTRNEGV